MSSISGWFLASTAEDFLAGAAEDLEAGLAGMAGDGWSEAAVTQIV